MFDIIGKRRWFYALSLAVTVPGVLFILLTLLPSAHLGLQFSIDYTGGTIWEVHFKNTTPPVAQVKEVLAEQNLANSEVAITTAQDGRQFVLIRTEPIGLRPIAPATPQPCLVVPPSPSPGASGSPAGSPSSTPTASPTPTPSPVSSTSPLPCFTPAPSPSSSGSGSPAASASSPAPSASAAPSASSSTSPSAGACPSPLASGSAFPAASSSASPAASAGPSPTPCAPSSIATIPTSGKLADLAVALQARFGPIDEVSQETSVGPVVSAELVQQAFLLIIFGAIGIMAWITLRFGDFRMGVTAIAALIHDVIVVVGIFAILGTVFGLQLDALFVTAMLTVIGFSVHDTIVVFDRIRENRVRHAGEPFEAIVNHSILQTIGRSINTSMTVLLTLTALFLFGGDAIRPFVLALLIGIASGTYSSIFNASPLLVDWHLWDSRRRARRVAVTARAT